MANKKLSDEELTKLMSNEFAYDSETNFTTNPLVKETEETEKTEEVDNTIDYNDIDYAGRGFKSFEDAIDFMETSYFKGLGESDKNEYRKWLIKNEEE